MKTLLYNLRGANCMGSAIRFPNPPLGVWRQLLFPVVLPQSEMLPKNLACFCPKSGFDHGENLPFVETILQDTGPGW